MAKSKLLLHTCCAVCAAYLSEILKSRFEPAIFFYNPNIQPEEEYKKRKEAAENLAEIYQLDFQEGACETAEWFDEVRGLEQEPEGGKRCEICFKMRLLKTASAAKAQNINYFATTLSASPYKNEGIIDRIGQDIAAEFGIHFVKSTDFNLNKKELWQKTRELAKKYNFYHQNYCGCLFSKPSFS